MKALKILALAVLALVVLIFVVGLFSDAPSKAGSPSAPTEQPAAPDAPESGEEVASSLIPGLNPVDVYLNLEQRGFTVSKNLKPGELSWTCTQTWPSVEFVAETFGPEVDKASLVRATVTADGVNKTALAGRDYLALVASIPYTGAQPQVAHDWVLANFDQDSSTTNIGGATFTLYAPTEAFRMLTIQPSR